MTKSAFAPANISCIFQIHKGSTPETTGSTGLGFTLDKGVTVTVSYSNKTEVLFNNKNIHLPTVESVMNVILGSDSDSRIPSENERDSGQVYDTRMGTRMTHVRIAIQSDFPLGCGFGISGASAIASAYAINALFDLKKTNKELAMIAHSAEVENGTGLGDVTNQYFGGCLLKTKPSYFFEVEKLDLDTNHICCKIFGELPTKSIIQADEMREKINKVGQECLLLSSRLASLTQTVKLTELLKISKQFAQESGLLQNEKVVSTINSIEKQGGQATMIMLGNAVVSNIPLDGFFEYNISSTPAHLI